MPTVYSPPVSTYVALATVTLSGTDASITFSSIPATYRDLVLAYNFKSSAGDFACRIRINGDSTAANYQQVWVTNSNSYIRTDRSGIEAGYVASASPIFGGQVQIMDYSATDKHKISLMRGGVASPDEVLMRAVRWTNTDAVSSLEVYASSSTFAIGSTFSLYGIEA